MSSRNYALKGEQRERAGKGVARALRRENKVPGVIYGDGKEPFSVALDSKYVKLEYLKGHMFTSLCTLEVGKDKHLVLARDVQLHPVTDNVMHVDFLRVTSKTKLVAEVPVKFLNEDTSPAIKGGGVLNVVRWQVEIRCKATDIPDHIDVDLEPYKIGDVIKIRSVKLPDGAEPADKSRDFTIATLNEPRRVIVEEPVAPVEGEAAAEGEKAEGDAAAEGEKGEKSDAAAGGDKGKKE